MLFKPGNKQNILILWENFVQTDTEAQDALWNKITLE